MVWEIGCNVSGMEYLVLILIEGEGFSNKFKVMNSVGESFYYEYFFLGSEVGIGFLSNDSGIDVIVICDYVSLDCCKMIEVEYFC